ncbi:hypothetical protein O7627_06010 [Solwaraspora sp. WMMD1047]|uniref:CG0192-related protein n=1 Tax=Solwaraspora sp. WMMD1047 TaxID=3016102 RepID=UPI00241666C4|nr:hypothetical protein [Solwaraspora sp. WMMD1047]MDG4828859.1 hypothetical protein [Solwaraspora sp. WMMD1047]
MALLHRATMVPTRLELIAGWLPGQPWYQGPDPAELERVASYRFDDPAGAVGMETLLVRCGDGQLYQVPLTYRDAPFDGGDERLLGTGEHSALGRRWIYDACGDPVYAATLASVIVGEVGQADEFYETEGQLDRRERSMTVTGEAGSDWTGGESVDTGVGAVRSVRSADPTILVTDRVELSVIRRLDRPDGADAVQGAMLSGTWPGQPTPRPLAWACPLS